MAGFLAIFSLGLPRAIALAQGSAGPVENAISPVLILVLCVVAGIGTLMLLPGRREDVFRNIGAVVLLAAGLIFAAVLIHYVGSQGRGGMSIYFWLFSIISIVGAVRVITHRRPVYSALYFVLSVLATAGLFILLWAEFMAAALVIIYAGAILVTYVFVIMLATHSAAPGEKEGSEMGGLNEYDAVSREPLFACATGFTLMGVLLFVIFDRAPAGGGAISAAVTSHPVSSPGSVQAIGEYLFNNQLVNLELAGLILTIAMVGAILIARRRVVGGVETSETPEVTLGPATPVDDNPHSIPVYGTDNPRAKAYPET
jgi:NADH-quinone oxidoreductase subunit J